MRRTLGGTLAAGAAIAVLLAGCVQEPEPMPVPTVSGSPSATPTPEPTRIPELHPEGGAAANHQFFDYVNSTYYNGVGRGSGSEIVQNLANNGFNKADMEVTFDDTAIGIPADSIVVSVRIKGECLLGQFGPIRYTSTIAPVLGTGRCLVGVTRPIDW
ncbi:DUF6993 domain-containing protein [Salinibacterium soli]|uniref:DUF6993 domain-containing protein n=1 Tax=Antiquaquibacter soli TaxID=3064523 RepID=A0ABT9BSN9_9MICO|nr:hypothetical protein [Protaetiibacter sp. WY-16]MDO7882357.1 hypothetical protein [Protaetiibacter sp. WY-16]